MRISHGLTATAAIGALLLTGCSGSPQASSAPSPTKIDYPDTWESCTTTLITDDDAESPNRLGVNCGTGDGSFQHEVAGDFTPKVLNLYNADETGGIRRAVNDGDTTTVWIERPEGTCLIVHEASGEPAECESIA
ncbi:MAG: hypothetical protein DI613_09790 [Kocuria rhizophila]|uniref:hypothetical protein n=1 Tax=Kocuria carniphila TaxID=262208 RepID=UPI000DB8565C|nr:MAG: hypothetical protein DI613_09790 [Kocuria rhizophila]